MPDVRQLGERVKAKYPGSYDDIPSDELGRKVKAKFPGAYDDFADTPASPGPAGHAPSYHDEASQGLENLKNAGIGAVNAITGLPETIRNTFQHPMETLRSLDPDTWLEQIKRWSNLTPSDNAEISQTLGGLGINYLLGRGLPEIPKITPYIKPVAGGVVRGGVQASRDMAIPSAAAATVGHMIGGPKGAAYASGAVEIPSAIYGGIKGGVQAYKAAKPTPIPEMLPPVSTGPFVNPKSIQPIGEVPGESMSASAVNPKAIPAIGEVPGEQTSMFATNPKAINLVPGESVSSGTLRGAIKKSGAPAKPATPAIPPVKPTASTPEPAPSGVGNSNLLNPNHGTVRNTDQVVYDKINNLSDYFKTNKIKRSDLSSMDQAKLREHLDKAVVHGAAKGVYVPKKYKGLEGDSLRAVLAKLDE